MAAHLHRQILLRTAAATLLISLGTLPAQGQVVINELVYDSPGAQFVELYNRGPGPIDVSGWHLVRFPWWFGVQTLPPGPPIPANGFRLVTPNPPLSTGHGGVVLMNPSFGLEDQVGWEYAATILGGNIGEPEYLWGGHQSANSPFATSLSRQSDGFDTNSNARDFRVMAATPGASNNRLNALPYSSNFSGAGAVPGWFGSRSFPVRANITVAGGDNPRALPPSPRPVPNSQAMLCATPGNAPGGRSWWLIDQPGSDVTFAADVWFDTTPTAPGQSWAWSIGVRGGTDSDFAMPDPTGSATTPSANGNTGVSWTYVVTNTSATLYLLDHGDGGPAPTVLASIPISAGNNGWRTLQLTTVGDLCYATFNGTSYQSHIWPGTGALYVGLNNGSTIPGLAGVCILDNITLDRRPSIIPGNPNCIGDCPPVNGDARLLKGSPKKLPNDNGDYAVMIPVTAGVTNTMTAVCLLSSRLIPSPTTQVSYYAPTTDTPPVPDPNTRIGPFTLASQKSGPDWWAATHPAVTFTGPFFVVVHYAGDLRAPFAAAYKDNDGTEHTPTPVPWSYRSGSGSWTHRTGVDSRPWAIKFACAQRASVVVADIQGYPAPGATLTFRGGCLAPLDLAVCILSFTPQIPGVDLSAFGLPGCTLQVQLPADASFATFTDAAGMAAIPPLSIPVAPWVIGLQVHTQWAGPSLGANPTGFVLSPRRSFQI